MNEFSFRGSWLSVPSRRLPLERLHQPADVRADDILISMTSSRISRGLRCPPEFRPETFRADDVRVSSHWTGNLLTVA